MKQNVQLHPVPSGSRQKHFISFYSLLVSYTRTIQMSVMHVSQRHITSAPYIFPTKMAAFSPPQPLRKTWNKKEKTSLDPQSSRGRSPHDDHNTWSTHDLIIKPSLFLGHIITCPPTALRIKQQGLVAGSADVSCLVLVHRCSSWFAGGAEFGPHLARLRPTRLFDLHGRGVLGSAWGRNVEREKTGENIYSQLSVLFVGCL